MRFNKTFDQSWTPRLRPEAYLRTAMSIKDVAVGAVRPIHGIAREADT